MQANQVSLTVKVNGRPVAEYQHEGRHFVEGKAGSAYSLSIKNDNPFRVKVVPSIDGVNAVGGQPATGLPEETGYVLDPYQSFTCDGYRLDNDSVAAFTFVDAPKAYANAEKGMDGTTGVIGLRVWREKPPAPRPEVTEHHHWHTNDWTWPTKTAPVTWPWWRICGGEGTSLILNGQPTPNYASSLNAGATGGESTLRAMSLNCCSTPEEATPSNPFTLGSTFGSKVQSKVISTTFDSGVLLTEMAIYYAAKPGLRALGVDMSRTDKVAFPQAFSGAYCTPPASWKG